MSLPEVRKAGRRRGTVPALGVLALAALLAGCTTDPTPTQGPKALVQPIQRATQRALVAGVTPAPQPIVVSFCYSSLVNTRKQLREDAQARCYLGKGQLQFVGEDSILAPCPLFQPVRATWLCYPAPQPR
ncbi:hypothetical protein SAMN06265365_12154 [Tistlia consotensis]|uniref:Lipoprotein n=1 Tax=Tistlia consotensis USBA 355 TaxID=560819 RepID=A0A1Y6CEU9_9PROT|nr:hypothetical protein [Tistlia consotensis]SMF60631.1 hypothetical protein SAMN05428998_12369 [Tistlia consotensis USBA 355]SNR93106.1 hypothetical protein SAMN06265365_12154 [Tistlia consotensis]